jgi:hypothetical protein
MRNHRSPQPPSQQRFFKQRLTVLTHSQSAQITGLAAFHWQHSLREGESLALVNRPASQFASKKSLRIPVLERQRETPGRPKRPAGFHNCLCKTAAWCGSRGEGDEKGWWVRRESWHGRHGVPARARVCHRGERWSDAHTAAVPNSAVALLPPAPPAGPPAHPSTSIHSLHAAQPAQPAQPAHPPTSIHSRQAAPPAQPAAFKRWPGPARRATLSA